MPHVSLELDRDNAGHPQIAGALVQATTDASGKADPTSAVIVAAKEVLEAMEAQSKSKGK